MSKNNPILKCGAEKRFTVFNRQDIVNLPLGEKLRFLNLQEFIISKRKQDGKSVDNEYLVINTDEPYIEQIIEILKKNNHWPGYEKEKEISCATCAYTPDSFGFCKPRADIVQSEYCIDHKYCAYKTKEGM